MAKTFMQMVGELSRPYDPGVESLVCDIGTGEIE